MLNLDWMIAVGGGVAVGILLLFVAAGTLAFAPKGSRYQDLLAPLTRRLAVTVGLVIMSAPAQFLTGEGWLYNIAALCGALWYWWTFVDGFLLDDGATTMRRPRGPVIDGATAASQHTGSETGPTY